MPFRILQDFFGLYPVFDSYSIAHDILHSNVVQILCLYTSVEKGTKVKSQYTRDTLIDVKSSDVVEIRLLSDVNSHIKKILSKTQLDKYYAYRKKTTTKRWWQFELLFTLTTLITDARLQPILPWNRDELSKRTL